MSAQGQQIRVMGAVVTNVGQGGRWRVVQTIAVDYGHFKTQTEAESFAAVLNTARVGNADRS